MIWKTSGGLVYNQTIDFEEGKGTGAVIIQLILSKRKNSLRLFRIYTEGRKFHILYEYTQYRFSGQNCASLAKHHFKFHFEMVRRLLLGIKTCWHRGIYFEELYNFSHSFPWNISVRRRWSQFRKEISWYDRLLHHFLNKRHHSSPIFVSFLFASCMFLTST